MRIAVDLRSLIEPLPSGVTEYTRQLVDRLMHKDRDDDFVLFANARQGMPESIRSRWIDLHPEWHVRTIPSKLFNASQFLLRIPHLDRLVGGADIFFMPNLNFASFSGRCKVVVTVHDLSFLYTGFSSGKGKLWHTAINPMGLLRRADAIVAVSESTARDLTDHIPETYGKISVIPSGVDERYFQQPDKADVDAAITKYRLPESYVLYLATVEDRKNVGGLLDAWRLMKHRYSVPHELVIAGRIASSHVVQAPDVRFIGYVPDEDKRALYNRADVFCYPSFFEGFGLPVLEAMASGVPTLTSFSTSLPEVSGDASFAVNPYNAEEIAHALHLLLTRDALRRTLVAKGKRHVSMFTWDKTADMTMDVFRRLLSH